MAAIAPGFSGKGFVLREEDVRRLADTVKSQLTELSPDDSPDVNYSVALANKSRIETSSLDEILDVENVGSHAVREFEIRGETAGGEIEINYRSVATPRHDPIRYFVAGENRDWVFRTKDEVEERIDRTTKPTLDPLSRRMLPPLVILLLAIPLLILAGNFDPFYLGDDVIEELTAAWQDGEFSDPIDAILEVERRRAGTTNYGSAPWIIFGLFGIGAVVAFSWSFLSKPYYFVWGDYTERFDRRQSIKQNAFWVGFVGLVVAVLAALIIRFLFPGL